MAANVYIFNCTSSNASLVLNGTPIPNSNPPTNPLAGATVAANFVPNVSVVARDPAGSTTNPVFATSNTLIVTYAGVSKIYAVHINPATYPVETDNLQLYCFLDRAVLANAGAVVNEFSATAT